MSTIFDKNILPEFDSVKDDDEEILWTDKPKFIPYAITGLAAGFGIVIFVAISYVMVRNAKDGEGLLGSSFLLVTAIPVVFFLWNFLRKLFSYSNTSYAFTNKRVMVRTGFIGIGVTTKLYDRWEAIPNVYEIFKKVKQVSVDIKTDYNFPNALRPETHHGYNTKYDRK
jgi:uncharacterized membrane protein YdbT with pleckstrin-like domain